MKKKSDKTTTAVLAMSSLLSVIFLWQETLLLTLVLSFLAAAMLFTRRSMRELKTFFVCGVSGAVAESIAMTSGVWVYAKTDIVNFPFWLPILWGIAAIFMVRVYLSFKK